MIFIIVALLIAIVSVIIGYNMMAPNDNGLGTAPTSTNSPASATNTPTDTANNYHQHHRCQIQQAKTVIQK